MKRMSEAQRDEIISLVQRAHGDQAQAAFADIRACHPDPDMEEANQIITQLVRTIKKKRLAEKIPPGKYALRTANGVERYKVEVPRSGRWEGYEFVSRLRGSKEEPLKGEAGRQVRDLIKLDPMAAATLYGQETGVCGMCGRTLTDEASRERGIGPKCAQKIG